MASLNDDEDQIALEAELGRLQEEHRDLDTAIEALQRAGSHDQLQLARLKKRKLALTDRIARLEDLLLRYGITDDAKRRITSSHNQGLEIEAALSRRIKVNLHEHTFDSGRLVKRA